MKNIFIYKNRILVFFIIGFLLSIPSLSFGQYYFNPYFPPYYGGGQQNLNQSQGNNQSVPYFIFASTSFAFTYPALINIGTSTSLGFKININGSVEYGPFSNILWYGFSNDGNNYGIVAISADGRNYLVIVNGRTYSYSNFMNVLNY